MLPDITKSSGIRKTVQVSFGGIDLRPEAGDGTFAKTVNMTSDKSPVMASRDRRRVVDTEGHVYSSDLYGMGDGIFENRDGFFSYNGLQIGGASQQGGGELIPFGEKIIIPWTREIIDLTLRPNGSVSTAASLPANAAEGDVYAVSQTGHFYKRVNGSWVDQGSAIQSLEKVMELPQVIFRSGSYAGERAENNTIEIGPNSYPQEGQSGTVPRFTDYFKVGDAVKIGSVWEEFRQTLIVREVTENELRFYEYTFPNMVGRFTVPMKTGEGESGSIGPGLYEVRGWDRFPPDAENNREPMKYFIIPSGTTLSAGAWIEYRYQNNQWNPERWENYDEAEIKLFNAAGTELSVTVTPISEYDAAQYPDGPTKLTFETVDCGEEMYFSETNVTISKTWPAGIQGVFESSNRLWGWCGHQIRCSKLGDPSNWEFFDGTAEDSWAVDVHEPDPFTGGISVHGYPTIFTEHKRYRIYGSEPEAFQLGEQDCNGARAGCGKSMAAFDGALYYVSRVGVMQDTGAAPVCVSEALGPLRLSQAVGGGHQQRYYVTGRDEAGTLHNLILDTRSGVWIDEGARNVVSYAAAGGVMHEAEIDSSTEDLLTIRAYGTGSPLGNGTAEPAPASVAETNDYTLSQPNRKRVHRVQLRFVVDAGTSLTVSIRYDGGAWVTVKTVAGDGEKKSVYLPVLPKRCDHFRLRFEADGDWELHSLALDLRQGSAAF